MRVLTFEESVSILRLFEVLKKDEIRDKILSSEIVYKNHMEHLFGECEIEIYSFADRLFIRTISGDSDYLEPLLIQVEDDGSIIDFMLLDFVLRYKHKLDLEGYYILQSDYSYIMDRIRSF